ncbi:extracellular calcium-sensing receptor-like [Protopterus annectens]|uniref:extracellular calcium-sensing receptor-like n=1 Tax=Protopterus annectens TaxID=7888 RepID=UPI001CFB40D2|nr:extracellular calcium-sensing receptor-like [Protopterus annectens]
MVSRKEDFLVEHANLRFMFVKRAYPVDLVNNLIEEVMRKRENGHFSPIITNETRGYNPLPPCGMSIDRGGNMPASVQPSYNIQEKFELVFETMSSPGCKLPGHPVQAYMKDGDILIGGMIPVHTDYVIPLTSFTETPKPIQCKTFFIEIYQCALAIIFAIEMINQNPALLPNVTLGFKIYDSCYSEAKAVEGTLWLLTSSTLAVPNYNCRAQPHLAGFIGDHPSSSSIPMARILGLYRYPQISYASSVSTLSDKTEFPSFLRTAPNNDFQSFGIAQLIVHFSWTWVGILVSDNEYGMLGSQRLRIEFNRAGICIAFSEIISASFSRTKLLQVVDVVLKSSVKVVVIYSNIPQVVPFMKQIAMQKLSGKVWIANAGWMISPAFSQKELSLILNGTLGLAIHRGEIPGFVKFLYSIHPSVYSTDIFINEFWETVFSCRWPNNNTDQIPLENTIIENVIPCTGAEKLFQLDNSVYDVYNFRHVYNTHNALYSFVHALHDLLLCTPGKGPFKNGTCVDLYQFQPWKLLHYLKNAHFLSESGEEEVYFDANGDVLPQFDILNWQLYSSGISKYLEIGAFIVHAPQDQQIVINESAIWWSGGYTQTPHSVCSEPCPPGYRKAIQQGQPICCFDCFLCSEADFSNETGSINCMKCPVTQWATQKHEKCVPKATEYLSYEEPLGAALTATSVSLSQVTLAVLCIFIRYQHTPIVKANNRSISYLLLLSLFLCFLCPLMFIGYPRKVNCILRQVAFGLIFSVCISCILAKTITVVIIFKVTNPNSRLKKIIGPRTPYFIIILCSLLQMIICTSWIVISPPFPEINLTFAPGIILIECNESSFAFYFMLGYLGLLAFVCFATAFFARKLPDAFNEAKFITFSMLVFGTVWLSFIPAYLSTKGKFTVAVEIFAILSSSSGLLGCIFIPKCYFILLRPDLNIRQAVKGKISFTAS